MVTRRWSRWALPGGTIRRAESPCDAARRELAEETGVAVDAFTYLFEFSGLGKRHHIFLVDLPELHSPAPNSEIAGCEWFRPEDVPMLMTSVATREIVRLAFRHDSPASAPTPYGDALPALRGEDAPEAREPQEVQAQRAQPAPLPTDVDGSLTT